MGTETLDAACDVDVDLDLIEVDGKKIVSLPSSYLSPEQIAHEAGLPVRTCEHIIHSHRHCDYRRT